MYNYRKAEKKDTKKAEKKVDKKDTKKAEKKVDKKVTKKAEKKTREDNENFIELGLRKNKYYRYRY